MARYGIAVLVGCCYVALVGWVVQQEGRAYREALHQARVMAPPPTSDPPEPPPVQLAVKGEREETREISTASPPKPIEPARPEPPKVALKNESSRPVPVQPPEPPKKTADDVLREQDTGWLDSLDLAKLKPEEEQRLGGQLHALILSFNSPLDDDESLRKVVQTARPLLEARSRAEIPYRFTVLDSDAVNAFSHPGGYVYVCRGMLDLIGSDEDYALEFVLGHEIAHVDMKHALKCVAGAGAEARKKGMSPLQQFFIPIAFGYPDAQEFAADAWAARQMITRLDRTKRETLAFLRKYQGYAEINKFANGRKTPEPGANVIENHFRAHPAAWDRLDHLKDVVTVPVAKAPR